MRLLKIGGNELDNADFLAGLGRAVAALDEPVVIVHGGGAAIAALQERLGLPVRKVDGIRVTDAAALAVTEMALSGAANKQLVRALLAAGVRAAGISGIDGGLLRCRPKTHPTVDLGLVGTIDRVEPALVLHLLGVGFVPVVSPLSLGADGQPYNVNADEAACALASALASDALDFVSNVPGVLQGGHVLPQLTPTQAEALIASGVIAGGMIPKVRAALAAVAAGVRRARIVNLDGLPHTAGTVFQLE